MLSCCSWACLDSPVEQSDSDSDRLQSYTNSAFSSQPSPTALTCTACRRSLDSPAHKNVCVDCKQSFCSQCCAGTEPTPRLCLTCQRFQGNLLQRSELMKMKVKELREYLHLHQVNTHLCREKEELVELIMSQHSSSPSSSSAPDTPTYEPPALTPESPPLYESPPAPAPVSVPVPSSVAPEAPPPEEADEEEQRSDSEEVAPSRRRASLSDVGGAEDIEALSVRQLKEILLRNFVDYKGCCEKWELMERVHRLYQDHQDLHRLAQECSPGSEAGPGSPEDSLCRICMDSPIDCVLLECGHMITCTKCGKRMSECPICRQFVIRAVHVFRS
ncbi:E3 ubiquitin-protein ligase rififylin isoform X2 [Gouania willdenowi]|uniref:RING-type E3 ubiquitin transferase n=1 Tax=Gouania willdenowi TaxID=441366 RepID=A0A8C5E5W3_GOUWI|nr:E3 ubiquitin-protein ligase rififylin isoform X2 [Gouania willdenowi]